MLFCPTCGNLLLVEAVRVLLLLASAVVCRVAHVCVCCLGNTGGELEVLLPDMPVHSFPARACTCGGFSLCRHVLTVVTEVVCRWRKP